VRPLRTRLEQARDRLGIGWETLERDYVLSWVLAGISRIERLRDTVVFKGGTALKKCYFGQYRFSEDLDFSGINDVPTDDEMEDAMRTACRVAAQLLDEYAPVNFECKRYMEREPHPAGQEAFTIRARLPWHRTPHVRVMVEISMDEPILRPAEQRKLIHNYGEPLDVSINVYSLEEIVAEKLRAILQHVEKLEERGWSRSRARDYYDIWRVLQTYRDELELTDFNFLLHRKCEVRDVLFDEPGDFFQEQMLSYVERTWDDWLGPLVSDLPAFDLVIGELRPEIAALVADRY
jgi:predicted nucleotidyltransferase component of viral defense system